MEKNRSFATRDAIGPHAPTRKEIGRSTPFLGLTLGLLLLAGCADSVPCRPIPVVRRSRRMWLCTAAASTS